MEGKYQEDLKCMKGRRDKLQMLTLKHNTEPVMEILSACCR